MPASGEPSSSSDGPSRPLPELKVHQFVYLTNPLSASVGRKRLKSSHWRSRDAFIGRVEELIDEDNVRVRWMYRPAVRGDNTTHTTRSLPSLSLSLAPSRRALALLLLPVAWRKV
mmetsp:Transcript_12103/g.30719  ORF Transcript_12103/g.30719 Transcript_12103/m.30719 type:complete len:115 (+) Transcript_12103:60-404(+)